MFEPARGSEGVLDGELQSKVEAVGRLGGWRVPAFTACLSPSRFLGFWALFKASSIWETEAPFLFAVAVL